MLCILQLLAYLTTEKLYLRVFDWHRTKLPTKRIISRHSHRTTTNNLLLLHFGATYAVVNRIWATKKSTKPTRWQTTCQRDLMANVWDEYYEISLKLIIKREMQTIFFSSKKIVSTNSGTEQRTSILILTTRSDRRLSGTFLLFCGYFRFPRSPEIYAKLKSAGENI